MTPTRLAKNSDRARLALATLLGLALLAPLGCGSGEGESADAGTGETATAPTPGAPTPVPEPGVREVSVKNEQGEDVLVAVATGELPDGYPEDLPAPPDAEPQNAMFIPGQGGLVTFVSSANVDAVGEHFATALPAQGWSIEDDNAEAQRRMIKATKGDRTANVIISLGGKGTEVAITLQGS